MDQATINLEEYKSSIELYKFYLELVVKISFYYYGITGAILSFYFSKNSPDASYYSLLLPILLSFLLGIFFLYGAKLALNFKSNLKNRAERLRLESFPNGIVLVILCIIFGISILSTGIGLTIFLLK